MLIECLSSWFSVGGVVLDWFRSYLSDRYQCIKIGSVLSDAKRLLYGVPQGSVLGPILLSLYTTHLSKVIQNHPGIHFHFYAYDTQLYVHLTHKHVTLAFERLKNCLDDVRKWLSVNKLKLNPDKTDFFLFSSKNVPTKLGKFSQSIYLVPSCHLLRQSGTLVSGMIQIFPFLAMSGISARLVLFISGI